MSPRASTPTPGPWTRAAPPLDVTVALGAPKVGLFRFPGANFIGRLETVDIGIPAEATNGLPLDLADNAMVAPMLPPRPLESHKGTFGHVVVAAGSRHFVGASVLTATAAYRAGAGLVTMATPASVYGLVAARVTEPAFLPLPETPEGQMAPEAAPELRRALSQAEAGVIGPGLGHTEAVATLLQLLLLTEPALPCPLVLDADALNSLADTYGWWEHLHSPAVLTPHPGELARLLHCSIEEVQADRIASARASAKRWDVVVVLKGAYTVVASPDGRSCLSPFANPALASGGTGDVLAGVIGALLAQELPPYEAAVAGVHVHASAGERVREQTGDAGLLASDLLPELPRVIKALRESR